MLAGLKRRITSAEAALRSVGARLAVVTDHDRLAYLCNNQRLSDRGASAGTMPG